MRMHSQSIQMSLVAGVILICFAPSHAADRPQWGEQFTRNMISNETGLPAEFDPETGKNVLWSAPLGGNAYGTPTIANGKVFIGANNEAPRDPRNTADCGVLLCLSESDGSLIWQLATPRIGGDDYLDWPMVGMCSSPTVEGDRVYMLTNRYEVVCLDIDGQKNGNDGPFMDEGQHMVPTGKPALEVTPIDADILWLVDLPTAIGMYPHDGAHTSILIDGNILYLNTNNGVDNTHKVIRKPDAPSLIALDKHTGKWLAKDGEDMSRRIVHSTWSPPALTTIDNRRMIIFGGPDGVVCGFDALDSANPPKAFETFKRAWRFDCDPTAPKENVGSYLSNRKESPSIISSTPVVYNNHVYVTVGGDIWWGKEQSWLKCIDATKIGDITTTGEAWSFPIKGHCCSTPSIKDGLLFFSDCSGLMYCLDAATGQEYWRHEAGGEIWGSTLAADGKVYLGSRNKTVCVLAATKEKSVLAVNKLRQPVSTTPVAANGTLYVATLDTLYALRQQPSQQQ
jgi:outer membrane protein assembly factor BamB